MRRDADRIGDVVGADRKRTGIAGHEDARDAHPVSPSASATTRAGSSRPAGWPSIMAFGALAQRPRQ